MVEGWRASRRETDRNIEGIMQNVYSVLEEKTFDYAANMLDSAISHEVVLPAFSVITVRVQEQLRTSEMISDIEEELI